MTATDSSKPTALSPGARPLPSTAMSDRARTSREHGLNVALAVVMAVWLLFMPLPLGSARPAYWLLNAMAVGAIGAWYWWSLARLGGGVRFGLRAVPLATLLYLLLIGWIVLQALPLGIAPAISLADGQELVWPSISVASDASWLVLLQILTYGGCFALIIQVAANRARAQLLLELVFFGVAAYALLGLVLLAEGDTLLGVQKWAYQGSATGPFVNRNSFATFLSLGAAVGAALLTCANARLLPHSRWMRVALLLAGLLIIGTAILATNSRMGVASAAAGILVAFVVGGTRARWGLLRWGAVGVTAVAGVIAMAWAFGSGVLERIITIETDSVDGRAVLYSQVLDMIRDRPLFGFGAGTFEQAFPLYHQLPLSTDVLWDKAHSTYLTLWAELGVIGGSLPLLAIAIIAIQLVVSLKRSEEYWSPSAAGLGAVAVVAVHSLVDFSMEIQAVAVLFVVLLALGVAQKRTGRGQ